MKNIDDFVREKLGSAPEKRDDAAAWLKMKDLLDKEMPHKAAPILFRWGKPIAILGISLLAASLCIGGYQLIALRDNNNVATNTNITIPNSATHSKYKNNTNSNNTQSQKTNNNTNNSPDKTLIANNNNNFNNTQPQNASINKNHSPNNILNTNNDQQNNNPNPKTSKLYIASANASKPEIKAQSNSTKHNTAQNNNKPNPTSINTAQNHTNNKTENTKIQPLSNTPSPSTTPKPANNSLLATTNTPTYKTTPSNTLANPQAATIDATTIAPKSNNSNTKPNLATVTAPTKDSITVLSTVKKQNYSRLQPLKAATITEDTVEQKTIALQSPTTTAQPITATGKAAIVPNSQAPTIATNTTTNTTAATNTKKKEKRSLFPNIDIPAAAQNVSKEIRNAQFFAGFMGGANYSIANNNNFVGIQFGPTGELVFNNHWSIFAGLKYFNRSGSNKTLNDNSFTETTTDTPYYKSGNNWNYLVTRDSTSRQFNFSTLHSFELPITVRYSLKKFYVMTGINLAYYLGINVEEVRKDYPSKVTQVIQTNASKPMLQQRAPLYNLADFGSHFGIGYILGAGYQISPAWQADLRLVQSISINAKTDGAKALAKDFYKIPSVQISVGYQFNRGKTKPKYGPTDPTP